MVLSLLMLPVIFAGQQVDWSLDLPIFGLLITWGVFMLAYYGSGVGLGTHHKVIWGGLFLAGLVPAWGALSPNGKSFVGLLIIGAAYMVTGLFDHKVFVGTFGPPKALNHEGSHVGT